MISAAAQIFLKDTGLPRHQVHDGKKPVIKAPACLMPILSDIAIFNTASEERKLAALKISDLTKRAVYKIYSVAGGNRTRQVAAGIN